MKFQGNTCSNRKTSKKGVENYTVQVSTFKGVCKFNSLYVFFNAIINYLCSISDWDIFKALIHCFGVFFIRVSQELLQEPSFCTSANPIEMYKYNSTCSNIMPCTQHMVAWVKNSRKLTLLWKKSRKLILRISVYFFCIHHVPCLWLLSC